MNTSDITSTVVLVHGAFVDAAYLTGFVEALGRPVRICAITPAEATARAPKRSASSLAANHRPDPRSARDRCGSHPRSPRSACWP